MIRIGSKFGSIEPICRSALFVGLLTAAVVTQSGASANPLAANSDSNGDHVVVIHSDDQLGTGGLSLAKSCLHPNIVVSEQKPINGVQSVLLIMKYDSTGKIVGVHYGAKDVCEFLQASPSKPF